MIKIYTDGSTRNNGADNAPGAWGFAAVRENGELIHKEAEGFTPATNQRAEMMAILKACEWAADNYDDFTDIKVISDSGYCINCYAQRWFVKWEANGWRTSNKDAVKNVDLWQQLIPFFNKANYSFVKTKGHANDAMNNMVDEMVQSITASMVK